VAVDQLDSMSRCRICWSAPDGVGVFELMTEVEQCQTNDRMNARTLMIDGAPGAVYIAAGGLGRLRSLNRRRAPPGATIIERRQQ
jgi:hypothetical protein